MNEIWIPDKLRERLVVGARVRFRVSGECPYKCDSCGMDSHLHGREGDGVIAPESLLARYDDLRTCSRCNAHDSIRAQSHIYAINVTGDSGFWAAAIELEPLDSEDES